MRFFGLVVASLVALGCGDGGTGGVGGGHVAGPSAEEVTACRAIAEKDCEAWQRCLPDTFARFYPDVGSCVDDDATFWAAHFFGKDSGATLDGAEQCGAELDLRSCDAWWRLNFAAGPGACQRTGSTLCEDHRLWTFGAGPEACLPKGPRQPGDACGSGTQCDTGICFFGQDPGLSCGVCQYAATDVGKPCSIDTTTMCSGGLECQGTSCQTFGGLGASCGGHGCLPNLICFNGTCHARNDDGKPCDPHDYQGIGNCRPDAACSPATELCEARAPQPAGADCGALPDGVVGSCPLGQTCRLGKAVDASHCVPVIPLGQPCTTGYLFGEGCAFPGECIAGSCRLRGPDTCD